MTERRYNDDEVAAIFARAAEAPPTLPAKGSGDDGLTLAQLQEIGREVGIDPDAVVRAARSLASRLPAAEPAERFLGLPIAVEHSVALDRRLTEQEWEHLVVELRRVFKARGTLRSHGSLREWTNGNLQALLEPTPSGHRLRLRTLRGASRASIAAGLAALGTSAAVAIATAVSGHLGDAVTGIAFLALVGAGMIASGALPLPGWSRLRRRQMEAIAANLPGTR